MGGIAIILSSKAVSLPRPLMSLPKTPAQRRWALENSIANVKIEGFKPGADFLADCEEIVAGTLSADEMRRRIIDRARAKDAAAGAARERDGK